MLVVVVSVWSVCVAVGVCVGVFVLCQCPIGVWYVLLLFPLSPLTLFFLFFPSFVFLRFSSVLLVFFLSSSFLGTPSFPSFPSFCSYFSLIFIRFPFLSFLSLTRSSSSFIFFPHLHLTFLLSFSSSFFPLLLFSLTPFLPLTPCSSFYPSLLTCFLASSTSSSLSTSPPPSPPSPLIITLNIQLMNPSVFPLVSPH